jgi:hypothetical protein
MKNYFIVSFVLAIILSSCVDFPNWPNNSYNRIHNQSGRNLIIKTKYNNTLNPFEYKILDKDSIEFKREARYDGQAFSDDSVFVFFEDGKILKVKNYGDNIPENFLYNRIIEIPKKGKYKNDRISQYYIKPSHYELAK